MLFCTRPHVSTVNFETSRFLVGRACGIELDGRHLELGDLVPEGLCTHVLRQMYEPPLRLIEVVEFAMEDPVLREAHARRQNGPVAPPTPPPVLKKAKDLSYLDRLSGKELFQLCQKHKISPYGNKTQLRDRLYALLA